MNPELDEEERPAALALDNVPPVRHHSAPKVLKVAGRGRRAGDQLSAGRRALLVDREEEVRLGREVAVDGALGEPRLGRDTIERGALIPVAHEHRATGVEKRLASGSLASRTGAGSGGGDHSDTDGILYTVGMSSVSARPGADLGRQGAQRGPEPLGPRDRSSAAGRSVTLRLWRQKRFPASL